MKFSSCLLSSVVLATSTLAAPSPRLTERMQRRAAGAREHQGSAMIARESVNSKSKANASGNSTVQYSTNWSGAVISEPPTGETFNEVSGTITVPTPAIPSGISATDGEYAASIWVGIDGSTYSTAILQTGIDVTVSTSGKASYSAWYEWYPDYAYDFTLEMSAGDVISMYVNATTTTTGSATVENLTTGKTATIEITSTSALGGENAEWIVEDFEQNSELVAFADFGDVTFTDCVAKTDKSSEGISTASIMAIQNTDGDILTEATTVSENSFSVSYTTSSSGSATTSSTGNSGSNTGAGGKGGKGGKGNGSSFRRWLSNAVSDSL